MIPRLILTGIGLSGTVKLSEEDRHHLVQSLRMREGDPLILCNGNGLEALCALTGDGQAVVGNVSHSQGELSAKVHLYPSLSKGERFEWMLQKSAELGAYAITPALSQRCVASALSNAKVERCKKILRSAAEQSGRGRIPDLLDVLPFTKAVTDGSGLRLFCYEEERAISLRHALSSGTEALTEISVMTGAEGGYTPEEASLAVENGWLPVSLGNTILRCETAPLMVLSAIRVLL